MNLHCPMPTFDFDIITLGHGSGGILTHNLLDSGVFSILGNPILNEKHDGALLDLAGKVAFTADSFVVSPLFFPGGDIGDLAVNGTVNDLAMCGAIPQYLSLSFIIEEGFKMEEFWAILNSIKIAADKAGVTVVTGDTKVVEKGKGDGIFINTNGIGKIHPKADIRISNVKAGDKIIVSGPIASHGITIMSVREGLAFESDVQSDTMALNHVVSQLLDKFGPDIHLLRDPTRGGVATVLNEIAKDAELGMDIFQKDLYVLESVSSACEILGLDPLYVANEGVFIAVVEENIAPDILDYLQGTAEGTFARCIGNVTETHPKKVILQSKIGGKRAISMLPGEQLPRIC